MRVSENKAIASYSQEEIQEILNLAIARHDYEGVFTREQLVEIAAELGISPESLDLAEREWVDRQGEMQQRQAFNTYRRERLKRSFGKYAIGNTFLVLLNLVSVGELSWSLYILLFWGLGLGLNTWNTFQLQGEEYEKAFQRWYRKYQLRESISGFFNKMLKAW